VKPRPGGGRANTEALAASLSQLAHRHRLDTDARTRLSLLLEALTEDPLAPTSVRDPLRALDDHLADSLVALELAQVRNAALVADLGAGAGVPGLPLAIALPSAAVTLVESNGRKCQFIARTIEICGLSNAGVVNARAEAWPDGLDRFDLVTARAVAPLAVVAEYAAPLLRIGGALLVWRGRRDPSDEASARVAATELGLEVADARSVQPYPGAAHRHLQLIVKTMSTPPRFPRRPGMARKRPLGG
jgi:16S rRNA (guanine527-N7)-methyltransferase